MFFDDINIMAESEEFCNIHEQYLNLFRKT